MIRKVLISSWLLFFTLAFQNVIAQKETPVLQEEVEKLKASEEGLWYADLPLPEEQKPTSSKRNVSLPAWISLLFKAIMWAVIAAVLGYIVYVIAQQIRLNKPKVNEVIDNDIEIESAEKLSRINFRESINGAIERNDYRLAVRFYYLWLIQQLSNNGSITFSKDKTNQAYVRELTKNDNISADLTSNFKICTRLYEYVWFGNFDVNKSRFEEIEPKFSFILNQPAG